jgi:hypothetical protein
MSRNSALALILMVGIVAVLVFGRRDGDGSPWGSFESSSKMFATKLQPPGRVLVCLGRDATLARWGEPGPADRSSHTVSTNQPRGARLGLIPCTGTSSTSGSEDDDPPVSVRTSEGPMCSVNTPSGLICTTVPMGCVDTPIGDRARDRFRFVP